MRRMFATLLLLGCLLSAVIPAASAKEQAFRDLNAIENRSLVMLLVDLGMISGYSDGTFRPQPPSPGPKRPSSFPSSIPTPRSCRILLSPLPTSPAIGLKVPFCSAPSRASSRGRQRFFPPQ